LGIAVGLASAKPPPPPTRKVKVVNQSGGAVKVRCDFAVDCGRVGSAGGHANSDSLANGSSITAKRKINCPISKIDFYLTKSKYDKVSKTFDPPTTGSFTLHSPGGSVAKITVSKSGGNWTITVNQW
jgi:hypothetical protein